jgi:hypothetical protein
MVLHRPVELAKSSQKLDMHCVKTKCKLFGLPGGPWTRRDEARNGGPVRDIIRLRERPGNETIAAVKTCHEIGADSALTLNVPV